MDAQQIHDQAEAAVKKAEAGDSNALAEQLNSMSPADRLAVAKEVQELNKRDRQDDDSLPKIQIATDRDACGTERLLFIQESEKRAWYNPSRWFGDDYDPSTVMYNPPPDEKSSQCLSEGRDKIKNQAEALNVLLGLFLLGGASRDPGPVPMQLLDKK